MLQRRDVVVVIALCIALMVVLGACGVTIKQLDTRARDSSRYTPPTTTTTTTTTTTSTEDSGDGSGNAPLSPDIPSLPGVGISSFSNIVGFWYNSAADHMIAILPSGAIVGPDRRITTTLFVDSSDGLVKYRESTSNTVFNVRVTSGALNLPIANVGVGTVTILYPNGTVLTTYTRAPATTIHGPLTSYDIDGNKVRGDGRTLSVREGRLFYDDANGVEDDYRFVVDSAGLFRYGNGTTVPYVNSVGGTLVYNDDDSQANMNLVVYHGNSDRVMETFNFRSTL
jgi:hypothetical protein